MKRMTKNEANIIGNFVADRVGPLVGEEGYILLATKLTRKQAEVITQAFRDTNFFPNEWFMGFVEAPRAERSTSHRERRSK
jgi:hypothetical protein